MGLQEDESQLNLKKTQSEKQETDEFIKLKKNLLSQNVEKSSINNIINTIFFKRKRFSSIFSYPLLIFISYFGACPCKRRVDTAEIRKMKIFDNGKRKFLRELDVVNLLQSVRVSNFLASQYLGGRQKTLLHFQKEYLVGSESDDSDTGADHRLIRNDFHH